MSLAMDKNWIFGIQWLTDPISFTDRLRNFSIETGRNVGAVAL
jgi:hypothetical protein